MTKEMRDKWVTALRSGQYKQGFGALSVLDDDNVMTYCAVGLHYKVNGFTVGTFSGNDYAEVLHMNDKDKKSFREIADWIEQNLTVTE